MSTAPVSKQYATYAIFTHPLFCRNLKRSDKFLRHSSSEIVFEVLHDRIWVQGKWIDCRKKKLLDFRQLNSNFTLINHMASLSNKLLLHIFVTSPPLSLSIFYLKNCYFCHPSSQTWLLAESDSFCSLFTSFIQSRFCWFWPFWARIRSSEFTFPYQRKLFRVMNDLSEG